MSEKRTEFAENCMVIEGEGMCVILTPTASLKLTASEFRLLISKYSDKVSKNPDKIGKSNGV